MWYLNGFSDLFAMCGLVALVLSIIALKKVAKIAQRLDDKDDLMVKKDIKKIVPPSKAAEPDHVIFEALRDQRTVSKPVQPLKAAVTPMVGSKLPEDQKTDFKPEVISEDVREKAKAARPTIAGQAAPAAANKAPVMLDNTSFEKPSSMLLEQKIGTKWIPIAGIILLIFGAAFFLKYAYENFIVSPSVRMLGVAVCGVVAIIAGEVTRRRQYEIVAKSVTALGFGLLYTAVFAGYAMYGLLETWPALIISVAITAVAMAWAVRLDEVVIAFLSLLGGFLTPIIIAWEQSHALPLFTYLAVLGAGAMLCAYYRKWRPINFLAFAGTHISYALWIINNYRPGTVDSNRTAAMTGLLMFFAIYFIMPILYELIHAVKAKKEDVLLILSNAAVTLAFLFYLLHHNHMALGLFAVVLAFLHFAMMAVVRFRCSDDRDLRVALQAIGLFMITVSFPQFAGMHTLSLLWVAESVVLAIIGIRYRSILVQIAGGIALVLGCGNLMLYLPLHTGSFRFILNGPFGAWCFIAAAAYIYHLVYRKASEENDDIYSQISQLLFILSSILLMAACMMEWYWHCRYNLLVTSEYYIVKGPVVVFAMMLAICSVRYCCPKGKFSNGFAILLVAAGMITTSVSLAWLHNDKFLLILNKDLAITMLFVAVLAFHHLAYRKASEKTDDVNSQLSQWLFMMCSGLLMAAFMMEWYWHCDYNLLAKSGYYIAKGPVVVFALAVIICNIRPVYPLGKFTDGFGMSLVAAGIITTAVSLVWLHNGKFLVILNKDFAITMLFIAALIFYHLLNRFASESPDDRNGNNSQASYAAGALLLMGILCAEWYFHFRANLQIDPAGAFLSGVAVIIAAVTLLLTARPVCPKGTICSILSVVTGIGGAILIFITLSVYRENAFAIFRNSSFVIACVFTTSIAAAARMVYRQDTDSDQTKKLASVLIITSVTLLWIALTEEIYMYWYCMNKYEVHTQNWDVLAHMFISIMWAVYALILMVVGFWRRFRKVRYASLALFALLLAKIFLVDTSQMESIYRVSAFVVTGLILVGVSYLYQYLKKKGFFEVLEA